MQRYYLIWNVLRHLNNLPVALALGCFLMPHYVGAEQPPLSYSMTALPVPQAAADFTLADMDDETYTLSHYRGKVVMLNFWATWCPPCRREMPSLERLYNKLKDQGFVVIAVNQFEDPDLVFEFTGRLSLVPTFPILFDRDSRVAEKFEVKGLPTTYLLDKEGRIRYRAIGGREFDHIEIEGMIKELL
ncbi:MAG: TlpA disulfide reductase family protein [Gammaproteobacteria bacterium]|nr:TlpA disulfide reductase family protein [Gammaproteobacteria bacterium]